MNDHEKQPLASDRDQVHLTQSSASSSPPAATRLSLLHRIRSIWSTSIRNLFNIRLLVLVISTCIVVLILLTTMWLKPLKSTDATNTGWGELEPFRLYQTEQIHNESLASAVEHQYIQMINKSAEQNGYTLTLNAVTADENRMIVLYTVSGSQGRTIDGISSLNLLNMATGKRIHIAPARLNGIQDEHNPQLYHGTASIRLDSKQNFPREIAAQFRMRDEHSYAADHVSSSVDHSPTLLIHFSLAPQFQRQSTEIIYPNRQIQWNNQQLTVSRVEISPLVIRVRFVADVEVAGTEAKKLWLQPKGIISDVNGESITLRPIGSRLISQAPYTFEHTFYSNLLDEPDSLQLMVKPREASAYQDVQIIKIK